MASAASGLVGFLLWLILRRPREQEDRQVETLKKRVDNMEALRLVKMELDIESARKARGQIRDKLTNIEAEGVKRQDCEAHMDKLDEKWGSRTQEFIGAVLKLERVGERLDVLTKRVETVSEEMIHTQTDLATVTERVAGLKGR